MKPNYKTKIEAAIFEAERFLERAKLALNDQDAMNGWSTPSKAAMKRASMDLARALVPLRKAEHL